MVNGETYRVTCVSFGTPHGAVVVDDVECVDIAHLGHSLGTHALFPRGASIVFIQVLDKAHIKARLWQHREGEIAFTPEAACVALTVAVMLQKIVSEADVSMGATISHVEWNRMENKVYVTGLSDLLPA
jgi:diaminopimelate epimerase